MTRPDWDAYFLGIARAVAARGECTRAQHGAVLHAEQNAVAFARYEEMQGRTGDVEGGAAAGITRVVHAEPKAV